ncbi:MAG: DUF255 domain-containing protein [Evtepia gabavorous]
MSNHLRGQTSLSPAARGQSSGLVPWGREALQRPKLRTTIFLSIGYSTCHWCHVMAGRLRGLRLPASQRGFVSIKVDREERPDDSLYMAACRPATGSGGWPTTLFLTPEQLPSLNLFPPTSRAA